MTKMGSNRTDILSSFGIQVKKTPKVSIPTAN